MAKGMVRGLRAARGERALLRGAVLRLGGMLGWGPAEVIGFAEAIAGCPWRRLGATDFRLVLEEYAALVDAIEAKAGKRSQTAQGAEPVAMREACRATRD